MAKSKSKQSSKATQQSQQSATAQMSKDEQVGFHKGSLTTLAKERSELQRILAIVEQLMQMHLAELKRLGVDLEKEAQVAKQQQVKRPPIDEIL